MALTTIGPSDRRRGQRRGGSRAGAPTSGAPSSRSCCWSACLLVSLILLVLLVDVMPTAWPCLTDRGLDFLDGGLSGPTRRGGIAQGIIGSSGSPRLIVVVVAFPFGMGAAIYLEEYAPKNRLTRFIELNIRNLAGVPSVVYGLLGLAVFVPCSSRWSAATGLQHLAGGVTLAVLVLPIVIITARRRCGPCPTRSARRATASAPRGGRSPQLVLPRGRPGSSPGRCSPWPGPSARRRR